MRKTLFLIGALFTAVAAAGCTSPCDHLQSICNQCSDQNTKDSCDTAVNTYKSVPGGDADCQAVIDAHTYGSCGS
jgi:hypothetical protein